MFGLQKLGCLGTPEQNDPTSCNYNLYTSKKISQAKKLPFSSGTLPFREAIFTISPHLTLSFPGVNQAIVKVGHSFVGSGGKGSVSSTKRLAQQLQTLYARVCKGSLLITVANCCLL